MSRQSVVMVVSRCANQSHYGAQQIVNIIITRLQVSGPQSPSVAGHGDTRRRHADHRHHCHQTSAVND